MLEYRGQLKLEVIHNELRNPVKNPMEKKLNVMLVANDRGCQYYFRE